MISLLTLLAAAAPAVPDDDAARAAKGDAAAMVRLGRRLGDGDGVPKDAAAALQWFRRAALQGDPEGQYRVGLAYLTGAGVGKDAATAAVFFRLAADQGHGPAQLDLSERYEHGDGVAKDVKAAVVYCLLAAKHPDPARVFGADRAKDVAAKGEECCKRLSEAEARDVKEMVARAQAWIAVHPRRFGSPGGVGPTRGWYAWRKYDPVSGEAELSHEGTGEVFTAGVLPWATTYRRLNYGCRPDVLLPGERVNAFFAPDEKHKRGFLVHFQDEIGQMKGHGHFWRLKSAARDGSGFTAVATAGDKPLDGKELEFRVDPKARFLKAGKPSASFPFAAGDAVYLTWCLEDGKRVAKLACDDASLDVLKKEEADRVDREVARVGLLGRVESVEDGRAHVLIFATHWAQAGRLKDRQRVVLRAVDEKKGGPAGDGFRGTLTFRQNRGAYGSGVTDVLVDLERSADRKALMALPGFRYVYLSAGVP